MMDCLRHVQTHFGSFVGCLAFLNEWLSKTRLRFGLQYLPLTGWDVLSASCVFSLFKQKIGSLPSQNLQTTTMTTHNQALSPSFNAGGLFFVLSLQNQLARQNVKSFSNHTNTTLIKSAFLPDAKPHQLDSPFLVGLFFLTGGGTPNDTRKHMVGDDWEALRQGICR